MDKEKFQDYRRSFSQIITKMKAINPDTFDTEYATNFLNDTLNEIESLYDEYNNTYIEVILDNNELYADYNEILKQIEDEKEKKISSYNATFESKKQSYEQECQLKNNEIITRYKEIDSQYIPKIKSIDKSKQENKQAYINTIQELNNSKIHNMRNYGKLADRFTEKSEMDNKRILAMIKRTNKKFDLSYSNNQEILDNQIESIEKEYDELIETIRNKITNSERIMMTSTAKLNEDISEIADSYDTRKKYGFVPYNLEETKLNEQENEADLEFAQVEKAILEEFKHHLQANDEKIEELKRDLKVREDDFSKRYNKCLYTHNNVFRKQTLAFDRDIASLQKRYNQTNDKQVLIELKTKQAEKKITLARLKGTHNREIKALKKEYLAFETDYINRFEALRNQTRNFETFKSIAIKNLHSEIETSKDVFDTALKNLSKRKELFIENENMDESKVVYKMRLSQDIHEENANADIRELERDIRELKFRKGYFIKKAMNESNLKQSLLEADKKYEIEAMNKALDYNNVITMLEIEKNRALQEYNNSVIKIKEEQALNSLNLYNKCDNLQYDIYAVEASLETKKLDSEINYNKEILKNKIQIAECQQKSDTELANAYASLQEGLANAKLYQNRFNNEKIILNELYKLYKACISKINDVEGLILTFFNKFSDFDFYEYNTPMMELTDFTKALKQDFTEDFYLNQCSVINTRLSFQKDVKFSKQYIIISQLEKDSLEGLNSSRDKIVETINNYKNGLAVFNNKINEYSANMVNISNNLKVQKKANPSSYNSNRKAYISIVQSKRRYEIMAEENLKSIRELESKLKDVDNDIKKRKDSFKQKFNIIRSKQSSEAKVYYDALETIQWNYNEIKRHLFNVRKRYDFYHTGYDNLKIMCSKMSQENANFIKIMSIRYELFEKSFFEEVYHQDLTKENHVRVLNQNEIKTILKETNDTYERLNSEAQLNERKYHYDIKLINDQKSNRRENIWHEIQTITNKELQDNNRYRNLIETNRQKLSLALDSIAHNRLEYVNSYTENLISIRRGKQETVNACNEKLNLDMETLDNKLNYYLKQDKKQRDNQKELHKNNLQNINEEFKNNIKRANKNIFDIKKKERTLKYSSVDDEVNLHNNLNIILKTNRIELLSLLDQNSKTCDMRIKTQIKEIKNKIKTTQ